MFRCLVDAEGKAGDLFESVGVNSSFTPSVSRRAMYWRVREDFGSVRMRTKSSMVRDWSSTRMGKRPWSSGMRSLGLET